MTPILPLEITLKIPLEKQYGTHRFLTLVFDTQNPPDFCAIREMEWRTNDANSALFHSGAPTPKRMAQNAPLSLPDDATMAQHPSLWGKSRSPLRAEKQFENQPLNLPHKSPQDEMAEAREVLAVKASEMASLDDKLAPARAEERLVRDRIVATHSTSNGVTTLNLDRRGDRAPLFAKLDDIARVWGPMKSERKILFGEVKTLEREIDRLQRVIDKPKRKRV